MLTKIQYWFLKKICPTKPDAFAESYYEGKSKLSVLLGEELLGRISGKTVIDFGCGEGSEAIEMVQWGARRVIGLDIREEPLRIARRKAADSGVQEQCVFTTSVTELAEVMISIDAFEHFGDPAGILRTMSLLLKPGGEVFVSFGPTWYHPLGGHLFSIFPWAHLIFSEKALILWRSTFKSDGATRFDEVEGGLNQMTIRRFERLVRASDFDLGLLELVPIRKLQPLHNRVTREFTTAVVRCRLVKKSA